MSVPMSFPSSMDQPTTMETAGTSTMNAGLGQQGVLSGTLDEVADPDRDAHIDATESQSIGTKVKEGLHKLTGKNTHSKEDARS